MAALNASASEDRQYNIANEDKCNVLDEKESLPKDTNGW